MSRPYVSIVIPTLNEQRNIRALLGGIKKIMDGHSYEIIVVDGNSTDGTATIAKRLGAKVLHESTGKGYALRKGIGAARGDIIISMDADLSNRPNELKLLIAGIEAGYDICTGSRFLTGGGSDDMPMIRRFDATDCPDLFPPLVALACSCVGKSRIKGALRLKGKESDRAASLVSELSAMGARVKVDGNRMIITGGKLLGGEVDSHNDHRIAMACAVAALASEKGAKIAGEKCVAKSYPGFFRDLDSLGVS